MDSFSVIKILNVMFITVIAFDYTLAIKKKISTQRGKRMYLKVF